MAKKGNRAKTRGNTVFLCISHCFCASFTIGTDLRCRYDTWGTGTVPRLVDPIDPDDLVNIPKLNMTPMMNPANEGSSGLSTVGIGE
jgi:hypothetical protein